MHAENFRVLENVEIEFSPQINVITGDNAQGKTSLLEAVFLLTGVKSFRTYYDRELIAWDKEYARLEGKIQAAGRDQKAELLLSRGKSRQLKINGSRRKTADVRETLKAVIFSPDDLDIVRGHSTGRRKILDDAISQLRPGYAAMLSDYGRICENKTRILKDWKEKPSLLDTLDEFSESLAVYSAKIIRYRASFAQLLAEYAAQIQSDFSKGKEKLRIEYTTVSTVDDPMAKESEIYDRVRRRLDELKKAEIDAGQCLVGAHKDDLKFYINDADAKAYASQGQTRTAALSVKMAVRDIFTRDTGEIPVLLLDDVLSELDSRRQEYVLQMIDRGQTIITCCEEIPGSRLSEGKIFHMEKGRIL